MVPEKTEEELYDEALRASCSACALEGRCVCGELDPIEEDETEEADTAYEIFLNLNGLTDDDMENDNKPSFI